LTEVDACPVEHLSLFEEVRNTGDFVRFEEDFVLL
jgi:hypothetical protein